MISSTTTTTMPNSTEEQVVVIGGGFGGLSAAIRMQAAGYQVTLLEKRHQLGGRAGVFKEKGYKVRRVKFIEGTNATTIRERMLNNENWEELVPLEVVRVIEELDGVGRIKKILKE